MNATIAPPQRHHNATTAPQAALYHQSSPIISAYIIKLESSSPMSCTATPSNLPHYDVTCLSDDVTCFNDDVIVWRDDVRKAVELDV